MSDKKTKLTRHEMREAALLILFQAQLSGIELDEIVENCVESFELQYNSDSLKIVKGVLEHNDELTEIISRYSPSRAVNRISNINLSILKIALFEMKYSESVPPVVAINEAVDLAKEYAEKKDSSFINGVLNSYYRDHKNE